MILATLVVVLFSGCGGENNTSASSKYDLWDYITMNDINISSRGIGYVEDENGTLIQTNSDNFGPYAPVNMYHESTDILVEDYYESNRIIKNIKKDTTIEYINYESNTTDILNRFVGIGDNIIQSWGDVNITSFKANVIQFHETYSPKYSANTYQNVLELEYILVDNNGYNSWTNFFVKGSSVNIAVDKDCIVNGFKEDNATQCSGTLTTNYRLRE